VARKGFDALRAVRDSIADYSLERLIVVNMDDNHKVIGFEVVKVGPQSLDVRVVDVLSSTWQCLASAVVVVHFVPHGDGVLGEEDLRLAERVRKATELMEVELVDYVVSSV
jgi:DNA repair protein RadC